MERSTGGIGRLAGPQKELSRIGLAVALRRWIALRRRISRSSLGRVSWVALWRRISRSSLGRVGRVALRRIARSSLRWISRVALRGIACRRSWVPCLHSRIRRCIPSRRISHRRWIRPRRRVAWIGCLLWGIAGIRRIARWRSSTRSLSRRLLHHDLNPNADFPSRSSLESERQPVLKVRLPA